MSAMTRSIADTYPSERPAPHHPAPIPCHNAPRTTDPTPIPTPQSTTDHPPPSSLAPPIRPPGTMARRLTLAALVTLLAAFTTSCGETMNAEHSGTKTAQLVALKTKHKSHAKPVGDTEAADAYPLPAGVKG